MGPAPDRFWPYVGADNLGAYEWLNRCTDPDERLEALMWRLAPPDGRILLDIGAGGGYHAVRYAKRAAHVYALEPDPKMLVRLHRRAAEQAAGNVSVLASRAGELPLADSTVDLCVARFAYFFGTEDCLPGLCQVLRALRPGGSLFVIEANSGRGEMGRILRRSYPEVFSEEAQASVRRFFRDLGFQEHVVDARFVAPSRSVLEMVIRMDFANDADAILPEIAELTLSQSFWLFHLQKPVAESPIIDTAPGR